MKLSDQDREVIESVSQQIRAAMETNDRATLRANGAVVDLSHPESAVDAARHLADNLGQRGVACPALLAFVQKPTFMRPNVRPVLEELAWIANDSRP